VVGVANTMEVLLITMSLLPAVVAKAKPELFSLSNAASHEDKHPALVILQGAVNLALRLLEEEAVDALGDMLKCDAAKGVRGRRPAGSRTLEEDAMVGFLSVVVLTLLRLPLTG